MSLNVKNERVHLVVRELANRLGMSQTSAIELAVREKLATLDVDTAADRAKRLHAAVARAQSAFDGVDLRRVEADLYDNVTGLPR